MSFAITEPYYRIMQSTSRYNVVYGGRGSGKSEGVAQILLVKSLLEKCRIICGREVQKSIKESSKSLLEKWIEKAGVASHYDITQHKILNRLTGSEFLFYGLSDVTKNNLTSINDIKYLWIEEAQTITSSTWERVYPSIRSKGSQIFITFNPTLESDIVYREFIAKSRPDALVIKQNWNDNPWFRETPLYNDRLLDYQYKSINYCRHIWEGELRTLHDSSVIDTSRFAHYSVLDKCKYDRIIITMDTAYSTKEAADYTAIGIFGRLENQVHVLRIYRARMQFNELITTLVSLYKWTQETYDAVHEVIIEKKGSGYSLIQEMHRLTNLRITAFSPVHDKYTRVCSVLNILHSGDFRIPLETTPLVNTWLPTYLTELNEFSSEGKHRHDDQVDVTVMAIQYLTNKRSVDYSKLTTLLTKGEEVTAIGY